MTYGEYMSDYTESSESAERMDDHIYYHCERCCQCGEKILPRDVALTLDDKHYFHEYHLGETTGKDLAIENGADPDVMDRWLEIN